MHKDIEGYEKLAATLAPKCHIMSTVPLECKGVGKVMGMGKTLATTLKNIKAAAGTSFATHTFFPSGQVSFSFRFTWRIEHY